MDPLDLFGRSREWGELGDRLARLLDGQGATVGVVGVAGSGKSALLAALVEGLCDTMPRHTVPSYLRFVDELPKTPSQRIQNLKLRGDGITHDTHDREAMEIFPPRT